MPETFIQSRVVRKQPNGRECFGCGLENRLGLQASFYETEDGRLAGIFRPRAEFQGYPGRLHGGLASTLLDETLGRTIMVGKSDQVWGVTVNLNITFRKPVPLDGAITVLARLTKEGGRIFEASGEIRLASGEIAVAATGRFMKLALADIVDADLDESAWRVAPRPDDPAFIDLPFPS